ncbi:3'(2'),5'-bisphosphate nucleotidase CysQ [Hyphomicrobium sp. 99]|uniref:3'(2'),5'-bisphosphate nucleotidase CysQ n=1 Tax=Hyphomicrobium sp. 99 TaxID=1163419 RepID=UPI0005F86B94|nr:3'(2'),5'-bisphosphate nucleotidase CysQ [Hyphomicrobium sp. 99]
MSDIPAPSLLREIESIALAAGRLILEVRQSGTSVQRKGDGSPVTDADQFAEELITRELQRIDSSISIVGEEAASAGDFGGASERTFFLVDPLDGTKEFIRGRADFTVNICLVENGRPQLGVVVAPARRELFSGNGSISYKCQLSDDQTIRERSRITTATPSNLLSAVASASHENAETKDFLDRLPIGKKLSVGSSLKFCLVATGEADIYPRFGTTMQWDTAAGDAVLRGAGGCTLTCDGRELGYGAKDPDTKALQNPHFVSFGGSAEALRELLRVSTLEVSS